MCQEVWFIAAGGSGVWLNVGRTAWFASRGAAAAYLCEKGGHLGEYPYHAGGACKPPHYECVFGSRIRAP